MQVLYANTWTYLDGEKQQEGIRLVLVLLMQVVLPKFITIRVHHSIYVSGFEKRAHFAQRLHFCF